MNALTVSLCEAEGPVAQPAAIRRVAANAVADARRRFDRFIGNFALRINHAPDDVKGRIASVGGPCQLISRCYRSRCR
jgi:hypothetical protein